MEGQLKLGVQSLYLRKYEILDVLRNRLMKEIIRRRQVRLKQFPKICSFIYAIKTYYSILAKVPGVARGFKKNRILEKIPPFLFHVQTL